MLLILMLTLSMGLPGAAMASFADEMPIQEIVTQEAPVQEPEDPVLKNSGEEETSPEKTLSLPPQEGTVLNEMLPLGTDALSGEPVESENLWDYTLWGDPEAVASQHDEERHAGPKTTPEFYSGDGSNLPEQVLAMPHMCFEEPGTQTVAGVTIRAESRGNGQRLDWQSDAPIRFVYVKGKFGGNLYCYNEPQMEDRGLVPPQRPNWERNAEGTSSMCCRNMNNIDCVIFFFEPVIGALTVNKTLPGGEPQENIQFKLQKVELDETGEIPLPVGEAIGPLTTDAAGQVVFEGLDVGAWYYLEENVPIGYVTSLNDSNSFIQICGDTSISVVNTPVEVERGTLSVAVAFSDANTAEVTIALYEEAVEAQGNALPIATQVTKGHKAVFENLNLQKAYRIVENPVPAGYTASYPDGQRAEFGESPTAALSVLNTRIPANPQLGTLKVNKAYSNGNTAEVTVDLYEVTEEGDVFVVSQTTSGLTTTFRNLKASTAYKIAESTVPSGYTVSYPDGQTAVIAADQEQNLSILNTRRSSGGGGGSKRGNNRTTTVTPEPVPEALPAAEPAPMPVVADTPITEEVIPLAVPVLPQTGELPGELFYGLGGMIMALGAALKRR